MARPLHIGIAGSGPAGLAAAILLHRDGHRVTVFERFEKPMPVGSGFMLQPTGLTVLHALGLLEPVVRLGSRIDRIFGADAASGRTVLDIRYGARPKGRHGVGVHRATLFDALHGAALGEGIAIETGWELAAVQPGNPAVLVDDKGRSAGRFDLVVDASGARSVLRRALAGDDTEQRPLAYGAFWTTLAWRDRGFDPHALLQRYRRADVMIGVLPIGRRSREGEALAAFFWSLKPDEAEQARAAGIEAWKHRVRSLWPACETYLSQIDGFEQMTLARYGHHTLKQPAAAGFAVIGDAAHSTSPQLGQGANMALLDAAALAHALRTQPDAPAALAAYVRARRRHVRLFQTLSRLFTPFYQSDSALLPFIRDRVVALLARVPPAPRLLAATVAGTLTDPFGPAGLREVDWSKVEAFGRDEPAAALATAPEAG